MDLNKAFFVNDSSQKCQEINSNEKATLETECFIEIKNVGTEIESNAFGIEKYMSDGSIENATTNLDQNQMSNLITFGVATNSSSPREDIISSKIQSRVFGKEISNRKLSPEKSRTIKRKLNNEDKENSNKVEAQSAENKSSNENELEAATVSKKRRHAIDSPAFISSKEDNQQRSVRYLNESSISPILPTNKPKATGQTSTNNNTMSLVLGCENDDAYDIYNSNARSDQLNDFIVNKQTSAHQQNLMSIESILNMNNNLFVNSQQNFTMYQPLTIDTNCPPIHHQLNTPLDYFNNEFTDELGITVRRECQNYIDSNNLVMIAPNVNGLTSNSFINVENIDAKSVRSSVVDFNNNNEQIGLITSNKNVKNENDEQESDESQNEFTYSQVEEEKGRAKPFKPTPVFYKDMNLMDVDVEPHETKGELGYALKITRLIFTPDELNKGIFPLQNGKSRSKDREPFDSERIVILQNAIKSKFSLPDKPFDIESKWNKIRSDLNQKIHKKKKENQSTNGSSVISRIKPRKESEIGGGLKVKINFKKDKD